MTIEMAKISVDMLAVFLAFLAALVFGVLYFALLWQAAKVLAADGPGWRFGLYLVVRLGLVLAALWFLFSTGEGVARILAAALGFFLARLVATRLASVPAQEG